MKIYLYQTYRIEKTNRGVTNHHLVKEGVLDHWEDIFVADILPDGVGDNDTSDRSLGAMLDFLKKNYPDYGFRYQEQEIDYRLSTNKAVKGLEPQMDSDIRSIGSGVLLSPTTYAAIVIGTTTKDMRDRAEALVNLMQYFDLTLNDLKIAKEGYLGRTEKFSWEKQNGKTY